MGQNKPELGTARQMAYESWRESERKALVHILDIPEFEPLLQEFYKDIDKRLEWSGSAQHLGKDYFINQYARIGSISYEKRLMAPKGLTALDEKENTEKWKLWFECLNNYMKRREEEFGIQTLLDEMESLYLDNIKKEKDD